MAEIKDTLKNLVKRLRKANRIDDLTVKRQIKVIEAMKTEAERIQAEKE